MKRLNNLYPEIYSVENLQLADAIARKGKAKQYGVITHSKDQDSNIQSLHEMLKNKTYSTSQYSTFKVFEPKERDVYRLPYYPDRICHHAVMNVLEPIFVKCFTNDTYSCIKGKGIHAASAALTTSLQIPGTEYAFKGDIKKFYPSVNHGILKSQLHRKFKDQDLLHLLSEIIDSADGLPIGNYLSQYFANFYLTRFDHWLKEVKGVKHYFRYADDIVILSDSKEHLHQLRSEISIYLEQELKLTLKDNYQVFPVASRGIDFVGYVHYRTHKFLRKSIKQAFARMMRRRPNRESLASYMGWAKHCNSRNLIKKLSHDYHNNKNIQIPGGKIKKPDR